MGAPSNELYSAFSFIGFVMCAIPLYWHLEAWNTGTCLYMVWTGIGCLLGSINSIVWNKNIINRAPVYCDIVTRVQAALNVAIPAASLCINRRLYKIATVKAVMSTPSEKRRAVITDLLIGVGIPILQMISQYLVSFHRYTIFEDVGPVLSSAFVVETIFLYVAWPIVIGCVSFVYCFLTIYTLMRRELQFSQVMSSNRHLNRSRYFRLMALSSIDLLCTIPLATYLMARFIEGHPAEWKSWSKTHNGKNYSRIVQVPASVWRAIPLAAFSIETSRWLVVLCAFIFFGFFGFADEARRHYRYAFNSVATRVGLSTSSVPLQESSNAVSSLPYMKNNADFSVSVFTRTENKRDSILSFTDQLSIPSFSLANDLKPDLKIEEFSPLDSMASSSVDSLEHGPRGPSSQMVVSLPTVPPASVPPHHPDSTETTVRAYSGDAVHAV